MPRQNTMAFAPVKLILLAVLLVQVASVIAGPAFAYDMGDGSSDYWDGDFYDDDVRDYNTNDIRFSLGDAFGAPAE